jgi:tetratricopeptide (TPR) repeat protein
MAGMIYTRKTVISAIFFLVLAGVAGFYINRDLKKIPVVENGNPDTSWKSPEENKTGGYTVKVEPVKSAPVVAIPDLNRTVNFENADEKIRVKIMEISSALKKNSSDIASWIDLGSWRKAIGDYDGARLAWEYVTKVRPTDSVANGNLGDLYAYYLKDNQKAETYFLQALKNEPSSIFLYFKIAEFYRDVVKDTQKAKDIVEQGIAKNPTSQELKDLLLSL